MIVTGGTGYVGSSLVPRLIEGGYRVRTLDFCPENSISSEHTTDSFEAVTGDIRDRNVVSKTLEGADAVVHLAALLPGPHSQFPAEMIYDVNYRATCSLVDLCKEKAVKRFVFSSSCGSYGVFDKSEPATEDDEQIPTSTYTESKIKAEQYISKRNSSTFHPTILRFATIFGRSPKMTFNSLVNALVYDACVDKHVTVYGPASWRPLVHIDDVATAILLVLGAPLPLVSCQVFNVGSDTMNYQKIEIVQAIKKIFPEVCIEIKNDLADSRTYKCSFKKISELLGFKTVKSLEEGIAEMRKMMEKEKIADPTLKVQRSYGHFL